MGSIVARLKSKKKLQKIQSDVENNIFEMNDVNYTGAVVYDGRQHNRKICLSEYQNTI